MSEFVWEFSFERSMEFYKNSLLNVYIKSVVIFLPSRQTSDVCYRDK